MSEIGGYYRVVMPGENGFESDWQPARLLSTIGLRGEAERECRATSALLAVMTAVPAFGHAIVSELGGPKWRLTAYTEIQLKDDQGVRHIPDGAIVCTHGKNKWCALVEVKTGSAQLKADQVSRYLDLARVNKFDAVITISNQITAKRTDKVVHVDKRKLKSVQLLHISWWRILTAAIMQHRFKGVSDPDQAWLLGELIAYLDNDRSGASGFQGMGEHWVSIRDAAAHDTLRASDTGTKEVASRWDQFIEYLALSLSQDLGRDVKPVYGRASTTTTRQAASIHELVATGRLVGEIKIPDAVGPVSIVADLRTRKVTTSVELKAPAEGRPQTRINWALKQLGGAPADLRVDVRFAKTQQTSSLLLMEARESPSRLLCASDPKREPRSFELALTRKMGLKRGIDGGSFSRETRRQTVLFYRDLIQNLKAWRPPAPKLSEQANAEVEDEATGPIEVGSGKPSEPFVRAVATAGPMTVADVDLGNPIDDGPTTTPTIQ
jgi:hypothetical protein